MIENEVSWTWKNRGRGGGAAWRGGARAHTHTHTHTHSEHRFPAPSSKEGCRKPVLGVWLTHTHGRQARTHTRAASTHAVTAHTQKDVYKRTSFLCVPPPPPPPPPFVKCGRKWSRQLRIPPRKIFPRNIEHIPSFTLSPMTSIQLLPPSGMFFPGASFKEDSIQSFRASLKTRLFIMSRPQDWYSTRFSVCVMCARAGVSCAVKYVAITATVCVKTLYIFLHLTTFYVFIKAESALLSGADIILSLSA